MLPHRFKMVALCLAGLMTGAMASAATITHTNLPDFQTGLSDGVLMAMQETASGTPASGAVGLMPGLGTVVFNDDFNQTTTAAAADYLFLTPNASDHPELATFPSQFLFSGDTPTAPEATAPPAGVLRIHASRAQDFFNTGDPNQRSPVLAINTTVLTGDFIVETKLTEQTTRDANNYRHDGLFIGVPLIDIGSGKALDVPIDATTPYYTTGPFQNGFTDMLATTSRLYGGVPTEFANRSFPGDTWYIRIIKRGAYFYSYLKNAENAPWVFQQWVKMPELAAAEGLVVGMFAKSFAGGPQYQDDDFDYLRVYRLGTLKGSFSNVFDAGSQVDWQTVALNTDSKQGTKYQLRAGNTLSGGTLTDAGDFVGPGGSTSAYFTDDAAQVVPNGEGKRYLEYKLSMDAGTSPLASDAYAPNNLPPFLRRISAVYQPAGLPASLLSTAADFGADAGGLQVQPGDGDLSLARTEIYRDDFTSSTLDAGWSFDSGANALDPGIVGEYNLTERPGYARLKVGWEQDFYAGDLDFGGVKLLRDLPTTTDTNNFEIETEVNMEDQQCRMATLMLWQDKDNWVGIGLARRFENVYDIGVIEDSVLNNIGLGPVILNYGSNTMQFRVSKRGTFLTISARDPASASPSWRVLATRDTAGAATGGADFIPTKFGIMGKSYGKADEGTVNYDFNYVRLANLAASGQKDIPLTLPAATRPDSVLAFGDGLTAANTKAQVRDAGGTFVGPDGTSATFFTINEPKMPASLGGLTSTALRISMGGTPASGTPYLHAGGVQYATGNTRVARDTNAADFAAGTIDNISTATPGVIANGGKVTTGSPQIENFDSEPANWYFSNTPPGPGQPNSSNASFTEMPGSARINVSANTDTWAPGSATEKPRAFLYYGTPLTGDFELETVINMPDGRQDFRHAGLGVVGVLQGGTPPDTNLDMTNILLFGPYRQTDMRILKGDNNDFSDFGPGGYNDTRYYLRLRKAGNIFTGWASTDGVNWGDPVTSYTFTHALSSVYVGFLSKAWFQSSGLQPFDFDYLKISPLTTNGTFQSRVLDLGATGLTPIIETLGGNSADAQVQFRAADTPEALASQPFVGIDGTAGTSFAGNFTGALPATFAGKRYFQYKATLPPLTQINDVAVVGSTATLPLSAQDVINALRIAGGLQAGTAQDLDRLDLAKGASLGRIEVLDAVQIIHKVNGR